MFENKTSIKRCRPVDRRSPVVFRAHDPLDRRKVLLAKGIVLIADRLCRLLLLGRFSPDVHHWRPMNASTCSVPSWVDEFAVLGCSCAMLLRFEPAEPIRWKSPGIPANLDGLTRIDIDVGIEGSNSESGM